MKSTFVKGETMWQMIVNFRYRQFIANNGFVLAILAAFTASSKAVLVKLVYLTDSISALELLTVRLMLASPFFLMLALWPQSKSTAPINLRTALLIIWLGFTGYYLASLTDFIGLTYISAGLERLVLFTYPTMVLLMDSIWHRRWPSRPVIFGVALCYLGLLLAFSHDLTLVNNSSQVWVGVGWVALSGFSYALYYISTSKVALTMSASRLTGLAGIAATVFTLLHFVYLNDWQIFVSLSFQGWLLIGLMSLLCTVIPSLLLTQAIKAIGPGLTANIGSLGPVLTIGLAWLLLGEMISLSQLAGMALVIYGIARLRHSA